MNKLKRASMLILLVIIGFVLIDCSMQKVAERHEGYTQAPVGLLSLHRQRHSPCAESL